MRGFRWRVDVASWCGNRRVASRDGFWHRRLFSSSLAGADGCLLPSGPVLAHLYVGQNGDPMSKIRQALEGRLGDTISVAAMKFYFWNIQKDADVEKVFEAQTIADLQTRFPRITFVHVTVPLFTRDGDWRAGVRRLLSMSVPRTLDNARRDALSEHIRARCKGREPGGIRDRDRAMPPSSTSSRVNRRTINSL